VQNAHFLASLGITLRHSGHFFVVGSVDLGPLERTVNLLIGNTTKKYIVTEIIKKDIIVFRKSPIKNLLLFIVKLNEEKFGLPPKDPISGVIKSLTSAVTIELNATPITTPTAKSTTLPRSINCLNPFSINAV